jgi:hypothetical protein
MEKKHQEITIQDLYPGLTDEEQAEAAACLARYIDLVCRIYERNQNLTRSE